MIASSVHEICDLYRHWGANHYDEALSQLAHGLQTAALAETAGSSDQLIVAALCHDIGHLLHLRAAAARKQAADIDRRHELLGAGYLTGMFPPSVTEPIALHVDAKRYLCATDAGYQDTLSDGSRRSLERQGGPMSKAERSSFEQQPGFDHALRLRRWDDRGKVEGLAVGTFEDHIPLLERVTDRGAR